MVLGAPVINASLRAKQSSSTTLKVSAEPLSGHHPCGTLCSARVQKVFLTSFSQSRRCHRQCYKLRLETLCLSQLTGSVDGEWMRVPLEECRARTLSLLGSSLGQSASNLLPQHHRNSRAEPGGRSLSEFKLSHRRAFDPSHGCNSIFRDPWTFCSGPRRKLDIPLLFNVHVYSMFKGFAGGANVSTGCSRNGGQYNRSWWTQNQSFQRLYAFVPGLGLHAGCVLCSFPQRAFTTHLYIRYPAC